MPFQESPCIQILFLLQNLFLRELCNLNRHFTFSFQLVDIIKQPISRIWTFIVLLCWLPAANKWISIGIGVLRKSGYLGNNFAYPLFIHHFKFLLLRLKTVIFPSAYIIIYISKWLLKSIPWFIDLVISWNKYFGQIQEYRVSYRGISLGNLR